MNRTITIDVSPLLSPRSGIGRAVSGLLSELPQLCAQHDIRLKWFYRRMLGPGLNVKHGSEALFRLRLPRKAEPWIGQLRLIERFHRSGLYHATDFYLPVGTGTPLIASIYDVIYARQPEAGVDHSRIEQAMRRYVAQCIRIVTCSAHAAAEIHDLYGYPKDRIQVAYPGVDHAFFKPAPPGHVSDMAPDRRPYFFAVSCNNGRKNTPFLVRAFLRYAAAGGRHDLRLAWTLPESLAAEVAQAGLQARVIATGKVAEDELLRLYQQASCVMFPSLYEGFGFPILEALACGTPVLTTRRSSLPEVGRDLALYIDGTDEDEAIQQMLAFDRGERVAFGDRIAREGPAWARGFTWKACAEQTLESYLAAFHELEATPGRWTPPHARSRP